MRFAIDAHAIGRHLTGNEVYIRNLVSAFAAQDREADFITYVSNGRARDWVPERFTVRDVSANPFVRLGWDLQRALRQDRPDLIHVQYTAPVACPVPVVVSVHDVSFYDHPEFFPPARRAQLQLTVPRTMRSAARILTGSEFSRDCISRAYGIPEEKIAVVPNAAASEFRPMAREAAISAVRTRFGVAAPFILSVGDLQPRKNHIGLIGAFADFLRARQTPHHLVLAGKETWFAAQVREAAAASGVGDRIHFVGYVEDGELLKLYNACEIFVFPSFYEGFGLPLLEAMACGRAVACSRTSAMSEVADGAAILFDPHSRSEIARALADLAAAPELRARMERLGLQRAAHFNWQRTAAQTLSVYYEVAGMRHPARAKAAPLAR